METKVCCQCKQEKSLIEYYPRKRVIDGRRGECKLCSAENQRRYHKERPEVYRNIQRESYYKHHKEYLSQSRKRKLNLRIKALTHYGNGKLACVRCGFDDIRALSLDHIVGGGKKHQRETKHTSLTQWVISNNFPEGFQTLCMNCQFIKKIEMKEQYGQKDNK